MWWGRMPTPRRARVDVCEALVPGLAVAEDVDAQHDGRRLVEALGIETDRRRAQGLVVAAGITRNPVGDRDPEAPELAGDLRERHRVRRRCRFKQARAAGDGNGQRQQEPEASRRPHRRQAGTDPRRSRASASNGARERGSARESFDAAVSGDPGCDDPTLSPTAIRFDAEGLDQATPVVLRIYIFRNREAWDRRLADVDTCAAAWASDPATFEQLQVSPYVLAGEGPWPPGFKAAVREAITAAAGNGG
jgi:hypothetical protein